MPNGSVVAICICPVAGGPMQLVQEAEAIAGAGLKGDRYCTGEGSFNKGNVGRRQITLINAWFVDNSGFAYQETRRNLVLSGVELMWVVGREFRIGEEVVIRGIKYCDPCKRPSKLSGNPVDFDEASHDAGGIVAEIIKGGIVRVGDPVNLPPKGVLIFTYLPSALSQRFLFL